jgi:hypothetical protein
MCINQFSQRLGLSENGHVGNSQANNQHTIAAEAKPSPPAFIAGLTVKNVDTGLTIKVQMKIRCGTIPLDTFHAPPPKHTVGVARMSKSAILDDPPEVVPIGWTVAPGAGSREHSPAAGFQACTGKGRRQRPDRAELAPIAPTATRPSSAHR